MGKTESIFAGLLVAVVIAAVALFMFRGNGGSNGGDNGNAGPWTPSETGLFAGFTGDQSSDLCTCYEQAFDYGRQSRGLESTQYRGGFAECSKRLGNEGADAWTAGWANGGAGPKAPSSCRAYFGADRSRR